ncbi:GAF domain-containing protein [Gloeocapsopsis sp. IPPAS B-1203]|uniref:GAF domain-containing protein n=1 Tax=Gloeocapsopsis sp. IPPAS B-1203 TaxID=2049454 RepID=UPI0025A1814F|nr:GAF domain-containing protein [Gloeocapsopsis sp. IPPAS B-1203]
MSILMALSANTQQILQIKQQIKIAAVIAILILPVLDTKASAENSSSQVVIAQNQAAEQARMTQPPKIAFVPRRRLPLTLLAETGAGLLLLFGLVAAYLANRTQKPLSTATDTSNQNLIALLDNTITSNLAIAPSTATPLLPSATNESVRKEATGQAELFKEVTLRLRQAVDIEDLYRTAVKEIRRAIRADRILLYQLDDATWQGSVVAESVAPGLPQTWRVKIDDPCFRERHMELYKQGRVRAINDIYHEPGLTDCHIKLLAQFAVKANLVAPIMHNDVLLGLLIAHQCDRPRVWQENEISLFARLATQVGFVISQSDFI